MITKRNFNYFGWTIFFIFVHFSTDLPGINIPGLGLLYPLRICLPFMLLFALINEKAYGNYTIHIREMCYMFIIMIVYGIFTLIWAKDIVLDIKQIANYLFALMIMFVIVRFIRDRRDFENIIIINMYILFVIMLMGLVESLTGYFFFAKDWANYHPYSQFSFYYPVVSFGNANNLIFVLFLFMPYIIAVTRNRYTVQNGAYYYGLFLRTIYIVLYCVLSFLASCRLGLLLIPIAIYVNIWFLKDKRPALIITIIGIVAFMGLLIADANKIISIIYGAMEPRLVIWANILKNAKEFFFMGTGLGNSYLRIAGVEYINNYVTNPHNFFLEIFAEFGIFVFLLFVIWFINLLLNNYRTYKNCDDMYVKRIKKASLKFFIYFILTSVMCSSVTEMPQFWLIIAFIIFSIGLKPKSNATKER